MTNFKNSAPRVNVPVFKIPPKKCVPSGLKRLYINILKLNYQVKGYEIDQHYDKSEGSLERVVVETSGPLIDPDGYGMVYGADIHTWYNNGTGASFDGLVMADSINRIAQNYIGSFSVTSNYIYGNGPGSYLSSYINMTGVRDGYG